MNFKNILKDQKIFNEKVIGKKVEELSSDEIMYWMKEYSLCTNSEILELLKESGSWKVHRNEKISSVRSNVLEELVDVFKYFLSIMILHGFTEDDLEFAYKEKSLVVEQRYDQEHKILNNIAVVDIDGTIGDYAKQFIDFVERKTCMNQIPPEFITTDVYASLAKIIGWSNVVRLKHEFRVSGEKRKIPLIDGSKEFIDGLKSRNFSVVMLTARPFKAYKRILWDTIYWLRTNGIQFDAIFSNEDKYAELMKYLPEVQFAVEDDANQARNISMLGKRVYLLNNRYLSNSDTSDNPDILRVDNFKQILEDIDARKKD